ncbi:MAG: Ig-like domain-containing protein [Deltaproteobacteria bacterium]|nr:Ig-like domain-containing protein [Deltaproteobacteria bacterium]
MVVEVEPYSHVAVVDPDRLDVTVFDEEHLSVRALEGVGPAIVYLFTEAGPRTLVFEVKAKPSRTGRKVGGWAGHLPRQRGDLSYDGGISYSHLGSETDTLLTSHRVGVRGEIGNADLDGHLAVASSTAMPWEVTSARLSAQAGKWRISAGDDAIPLASRLSQPAVRGARLEWRDEAHHRAVGAAIGSVVPWWCCAYLDPDQPVVVTAYGSARTGEATRIGASTGFTRDPKLERTLPHARLDLELNREDTQAQMEGYFSGDGGGGFASLQLGGTGRFYLDATAEGVSRGFYDPSAGVLRGDRVMVRVQPAVRPTEWLRLVAAARGVYSSSELSPARASAIAGGWVHLSPRRWGLSAGYQREDGWMVEEGLEPLSGSHLLDLAVSARSERTWVQAGAQTRLEDAGGYAASISGVAAWDPDGPWTLGVTERWTFGTAVPMSSVQVYADVARRSTSLEMHGTVGARTTFAPDQTQVLPTVRVGARWVAHPSHRFGVWTALSSRPDSPSHIQAMAQYSYDGWRGRPGARAVGLQGAIRGVVFDDLDEDGLRDPGEPGVGGMPVRLDGRQQVTDEDGGYRFGLVSNGLHEVSIDRDGWRSINGTVQQVEVRSLKAAEAEFALSSAGRVLARVYLDRDHDGSYSSTDRAVRATGVALVSVAQGDVVARGDARQGLVDFPGVPPGAYVVALDASGLPEGYFPSDSGQAYAQVTKGAIVNVHLPVDALRTIGGRVFLDANRNGVRDGGDTPAPHTLVSLDDGHQRRTDLAGNFLFRRLSSGLYQVSVPGAYATEKIDLSNGPSEELGLEMLVDPRRAVTGVDFEPAVSEVAPEATPIVDPAIISPVEPTAAEEPLAKLETLRLHPSDLLLPVDHRAPLTALGSQTDGTVTEVTDKVTWTTSDPEVAQVDAEGRVTAMAFGLARIVGELDGIRSEPVTVEVADVPVVGLTLSPPAIRLGLGESTQLTAKAVLVDGRIDEVTAGVRWQSNNEGVAQVSDTGVVTGTGFGEAGIYAEAQGVVAYPVRAVVSEAAVSEVRLRVLRAAVSEVRLRVLREALFLGDPVRAIATAVFEDGSERSSR